MVITSLAICTLNFFIKHSGIDFIHINTLSHLVKGTKNRTYESLLSTLRKEEIVGVTCWELKSHLFKAKMLSTFTYGTEIWGGDLKNSHRKVFREGHEDA